MQCVNVLTFHKRAIGKMREFRRKLPGLLVSCRKKNTLNLVKAFHENIRSITSSVSTEELALPYDNVNYCMYHNEWEEVGTECLI